MKKNLLFVIAAGGLLAGSSNAQRMPNPAPTPPSPLTGVSPRSDEAAPKGDNGAAPALGSELSGKVTAVDKDKLSLNTPNSGPQDLKVSPAATITRDGNTASLDQLKPGDQVRASFDPQSKEATALDVHSKSGK